MHASNLLGLAVAGTLAIAGEAVRTRTWTPICGTPLQAARMQLQRLSDAARMFEIERGRLPQRLEDLTGTSPKTGGPYVDRIPLDPWGRAYAWTLRGGVVPPEDVRPAGEAPGRRVARGRRC